MTMLSNTPADEASSTCSVKAQGRWAQTKQNNVFYAIVPDDVDGDHHPDDQQDERHDGHHALQHVGLAGRRGEVPNLRPVDVAVDLLPAEIYTCYMNVTKERIDLQCASKLGNLFKMHVSAELHM